MDGWILYQVSMVVQWLALTSHSMSICQQLPVSICWYHEELPTHPWQKAALAQRQLWWADGLQSMDGWISDSSSCLFRDYIGSTGSNSDDQPTHVTVGVQTDYRESETQTDPYSPDYVVQPGTTPSELLQLAALTWGRAIHTSQGLVIANHTGFPLLFRITLMFWPNRPRSTCRHEGNRNDTACTCKTSLESHPSSAGWPQSDGQKENDDGGDGSPRVGFQRGGNPEVSVDSNFNI